jgi:4-hydroxythreonine-4-phosphate dehydrogenase
MIPRILITPGEPAGVGPDITIQLLQQSFAAELIIVADPELLTARAKQLQLPLTLLPYSAEHFAAPHQPGTAKIIPVALHSPVVAGQLNVDNAAYVLHCLETATALCLHKKADALVTGPVHKSILNQAGITFTGHTEFLAEQCEATQPVMLFVTPQTKVALLTTHLPLAEVPAAITANKLEKIVHILDQELKSRFGIAQPRILVAGLNPHAGEQGHLGREEIDIITPALVQLRRDNIDVIGPLPADTIFTPKYLSQADVILAMYHDQALPVVKFMDFSHTVNVTLGLPIIRTSVDHGTALDVAGTLHADAGSLIAATQLALTLTHHH